MLESLRNAAGTWVAKLLLLLLVLSFGVWGISGQLTQGFNSNTVITAGSTQVSVTDYRLAYDRQLRVLSQQFGQRITREQAQAFGVDQQVLAQLLAGAVLDELAGKMNLGLSKDRLAALAADDPAFRGADGRFDRRAFDSVLRNAGMRPDDYIRNREQVAIRQQIVEAVSDGMSAPDAYFKAEALYRGEDRTVEAVVMPATLVEPVAEPDAAALTAYFDEHKAEFGAPEYRKISYLLLDPQTTADPTAITDAQVAEEYERRKASYTTSETRKVDQIVFKDEAAAADALKKILAGATFDQIVEAEGKKPEDVSLGDVKKSAIPDPAIADAAFALRQNEVSQVVKGAFGPVLLRVTAITPETVKPLDEVAAEIRKDLAVAEASKVLLETHDAYEDARAGGETMEEAGARLKLPVKTVDAIDRKGLAPDETVIKDLPDSTTLIEAAFKAEPKAENPSINVGRDGFLWYEIMDVTPARDRSLDEVKEKVIAAWKADEAAKRLTTKAEDLRKQLDGGRSLDEIATELGVEKLVKRGVKRSTDDPDLGEAGVAAAFSVQRGKTGLVAGSAAGSQVLFKVTEVFEPAGAGPEALAEADRKTLSSAFADDLLDQLVTDLRTRYGVSVDNRALQSALTF